MELFCLHDTVKPSHPQASHYQAPHPLIVRPTKNTNPIAPSIPLKPISTTTITPLAHPAPNPVSTTIIILVDICLIEYQEILRLVLL